MRKESLKIDSASSNKRKRDQTNLRPRKRKRKDTQHIVRTKAKYIGDLIESYDSQDDSDMGDNEEESEESSELNINGLWIREESGIGFVYVIKDYRVTYDNGMTEKLIAENESQFKTKFNGECFSAVLDKDKMKIVWSDGDMWYRQSSLQKPHEESAGLNNENLSALLTSLEGKVDGSNKSKECSKKTDPLSPADSENEDSDSSPEPEMFRNYKYSPDVTGKKKGNRKDSKAWKKSETKLKKFLKAFVKKELKFIFEDMQKAMRVEKQIRVIEKILKKFLVKKYRRKWFGKEKRFVESKRRSITNFTKKYCKF